MTGAKPLKDGKAQTFSTIFQRVSAQLSPIHRQDIRTNTSCDFVSYMAVKIVTSPHAAIKTRHEQQSVFT